jgi:hypothetical protein
VVTLPEVTPVSQAAALQEDLRRAGIEPYAWVLNKSVPAAGTHDPLLATRLADPPADRVCGTVQAGVWQAAHTRARSPIRSRLLALAGEAVGIAMLLRWINGITNHVHDHYRVASTLRMRCTRHRHPSLTFYKEFQ